MDRHYPVPAFESLHPFSHGSHYTRKFMAKGARHGNQRVSPDKGLQVSPAGQGSLDPDSQLSRRWFGDRDIPDFNPARAG
jgi:hypothetical protein